MIDASARRAIQEELEVNFLVEASAGTGKTHSLTSRIVAGIVSGAYDPAKVVAVTFTRKAAAELRARVRLGLEQAGVGDEMFDQVFIGTVHAFCARILQNFPVESGLSPGFREIEESHDREMRQHFLRLGVDRQMLGLLAEFDSSIQDLWPALELMVENGDVEYASTAVKLPDLGEAWAAVDEFCEHLRLPITNERHPTCKLLVHGRELHRQRRLADRSRLRDLIRLLSAWESDLTPVKRYWGSGRQEQNARLEALTFQIKHFRATVARPFLETCRTHLYGECVPVLQSVAQRCREERRRLGLVNFNDLLCHTLELLRRNEAIRSSLKLHVLVDEFQDTDPLQAEIFFLFSGPGRNMGDIVPRPGSLFLVGDPKQSIYRFRRADMHTYQAVRRRLLETGGRTLSLCTSFRSRGTLCSSLNQNFAAKFPATPTDSQAAHATLRAFEETGGEVARLTVCTDRAQDVSDHEAEIIANHIAHLVQGKGTHTWKDFLILTARKAEVRIYQRALERHNIPCEAPVEHGPMGARAASLLPLLRHLADPQDNATLVGVLRGPLFGHSDEELFLHVQEVGTLRPYGVKGTSAVQSSIARLDKLRLATRSLPPGAAMALAIEQTGLMALAVLEGPSSVAQLRGMLDAMRRGGEAGLTLAQSVAQLEKKGVVELQSGSFGQRDAVRVLNVHKAKGLEARVVFLAAPTAGFSLTADQSVDQERRGAFCLRKHRQLLAHPPGWSELEARELELLRAEQVRFLYVAATRAKETLVVSHWNGANRSISRPWLGLEGARELERLSATVPRRNDPGVAAARLDRSAASWQRGKVTLERAGAHLKPVLPPDEIKVDAQEWGHLIHRLLENLVRQPELERPELLRLGKWLCFDQPRLLEALPTALNVLDGVKKSQLWDWIEDAELALVEVPFATKQGRRVLFGTIDLALRRKDGWGLVDYKTDRQVMATLVGTYARQIEQYASSWAEVLEEPLRYAGLYAVRENQLSPDLRF